MSLFQAAEEAGPSWLGVPTEGQATRVSPSPQSDPVMQQIKLINDRISKAGGAITPTLKLPKVFLKLLDG